MVTVERVIPETYYQIRVSERTAEALAALLGGIKYPEDGRMGLDEIYEQLEHQMPFSEVTYTDLFEGDVRMR